VLPEDLSDDALGRALSHNRWGAPRRVFSSIGSTNAEALEWARRGAPEGALVVADHQTAGRGRWGRTWLDREGGSLMFSIVLRPPLVAEDSGLLPTAVGAAVAEGLERATGLPAQLKWPNDVMVRGRKLAGILLETSLAGPALDFAVAGVGINVGVDVAELGDELRDRATSVTAEVARSGAGVVPSRAELLAALVRAMEEAHPLLSDDRGRREIVRRASRRSAVLGREVTVQGTDGARITGLARELSLTGALVVEGPGGPVQLVAGEVASVRTTEGG
jgi:BirA family biotin operon repressor/biotin-[acetyl-CoA-carboxylase] ligase